MKPLAVCLLGLIVVGCAITGDQAVALASQQLARGHRPVPRSWRISVLPCKDYARDADLWALGFYSPPPQKDFYLVFVNKYTHRVEEIRDQNDPEPTTTQ